MGKFLMKEVSVVIDGVDLSDHCFSVDTPSEKERVEVSGFNEEGTREYLAGNREDTVTLGVLQDFAAGSVHATLYPIYRDDEVVPIAIRHLSSQAVSATNPQLTGNAQMLSYNGLSGELNARAEMTVNLIAADSAGLVWSIT